MSFYDGKPSPAMETFRGTSSYFEQHCKVSVFEDRFGKVPKPPCEYNTIVPVTEVSRYHIAGKPVADVFPVATAACPVCRMPVQNDFYAISYPYNAAIHRRCWMRFDWGYADWPFAFPRDSTWETLDSSRARNYHRDPADPSARFQPRAWYRCE